MHNEPLHCNMTKGEEWQALVTVAFIAGGVMVVCFGPLVYLVWIA